MGSTAQSIFNAIELLAESIRSKYRLGFNRAIEVVAPHWLLGAIRADLSYRTGLDDGGVLITDQIITSAFATRNVAVQWVEDWQPLSPGTGTPPTEASRIACVTHYPATVDLLIYPSGTFVKAVTPVISLNAVYDSASLLKNEYTGLFFEEGVAVAKTCYSGCKAVISLCNAGITGAASNTECGVAVVAPARKSRFPTTERRVPWL